MEVTHNPRYPYKPPIPLTVAINPVITPLDDELVEINEGCLSVPLRGTVFRHVNVRVQYLDRDGVAHDEVKRGLTAGTWQHECDHLDGVLFVDRVADPTTLTTWAEFEALPPRRVRRADHAVRRARRVAEMTTWWCEHAVFDDIVHADVTIEADAGRFTAITARARHRRERSGSRA